MHADICLVNRNKTLNDRLLEFFESILFFEIHIFIVSLLSQCTFQRILFIRNKLILSI